MDKRGKDHGAFGRRGLSVEEVCLKRAGLVIWPAVGAPCYGILGGFSASSVASNWVPGVRDVLMPAVMCVVLGFQVGALALARQHQGLANVTIPAGGTGAGNGTTARSD
jgi:hypothetical protein